MYRLSLTVLFLHLTATAFSQSPHGSNFKINCSECHQTESWKVVSDSISFDHNKETDFDLTGQHSTVDCRSCHTSLIFSKASNDCFSCHKDIHLNTVGQDCGRCHTPETWIVKDIVQIHQNSRFPLAGAHLRSDCFQCHPGYPNFTFEPIGITCFDCHSTNYFATTSPNHSAAGFSTNCEECHSIIDPFWSAGNFNHDFFPLTGGHNIQNCFACHKAGGNYSGLSPECYSCHKSDYELVKDPNHASSGFSTVCTLCHNIQAWVPGGFDHSLSQFPLTGSHVGLSCSSCHSQGFSGTPIQCYSCHSAAYSAAVNPNHTAAGISTECQDCHTTTLWIPSNFDHTGTGFELTGKHILLSCSSCHVGTTAGLSTLCYSCHQNDYNTAENHLSQSYPTTCEMCHTTAGWEGADFNHDVTGFPLTGGHITAGCLNCHQNGFPGTSTLCADCHQSNYNSAVNPSHTVLALSTECGICHSTTPGWSPALFPNHNNYYQLLGAHALITDCISCHNGNYNSTPNTCYGCHSINYNNTSNPVHANLALSTDCSICHTTDLGWSPALFPNHNDYYQLLGAHALISSNCTSCHNGNYNVTPNTCFGCHSTNYSNTTNPVHSTAGFNTECATCHSQDAWSPSTFNHDGQYFPIYSGKHNGQWSLCSDCHTNSADFSVFSCINCHEHNRTETDNQHTEVSGYSYLSSACYSCHPAGTAEGGDFHLRNRDF